MISILIIDDEDKLRGLLKRIISLEGYKVHEVGTIEDGRQYLSRQDIDIILCDVKLPDGNGVSFTKEVKEKYPVVEIILLTAFGNIPDGVQAIKNGAFDYLVKGNDNDKIIPLLSRVSEKIALQQRVQRLEQQVNNKFGFEGIIGKSFQLQHAIELARKVAATDTTVLLTGETGTGKEVFAQAIHQSSKRSGNTFIALNCSSFSKELLESELFGYKTGAFTGAVKDKKGLIEEAKGGTLFLDEIGEMPADLQPKLLRFLENGTFYRLGETTERKADVRIIAATNRDLQREIGDTHFRSDLYYRLAVFTIELPPLRERQKDIPLLAQHYLLVYTQKTNKNIDSITKEAVQALESNAWKGNIRELKNIIERAVILEDSNTLTLQSFPFEIQYEREETNTASSFKLAAVEKRHIEKVLTYTKGNKAEAARLMDIGIATLYRKIEEYCLK